MYRKTREGRKETHHAWVDERRKRKRRTPSSLEGRELLCEKPSSIRERKGYPSAREEEGCDAEGVCVLVVGEKKDVKERS